MNNNRRGVLIAFFLAIVAAAVFWFTSKNYEAEVDRILSQCALTKGQSTLYNQCIQRSLSPIVGQLGVGKVMEVIESLNRQKKGNTTGSIECHDLGHLVGQLGVDLARNPAEVIVACSRSCGFGCVHGAALAAIRKDPKILTDLDLICEPFAAKNYPGQELTGCRHGIGHGLTEYSALDVSKALTYCDAFSDQVGKDECATGVFMEAYEAPLFQHKKIPVPSDFVSFCKNLSPSFQRICRMNMAIYMFSQSGDIAQGYSICMTYDASDRKWCAVGLGQQLYFRYPGETRKILDGCATFDPSHIFDCVRGVTISSFVNVPDGSFARSICDHVGERMQNDCQSLVVTELQKLHEQE